MRLELNSLDELAAVAEQILTYLEQHNLKFVAISGEMGAGKTTLVNQILKSMQVEGDGSSPTFSIVNEYFSVNYGIIYHFDFYRIKNEIEAYDIGIEEIFEEDAYIFVEWPEKIENLLPENSVRMSIEVDDHKRTIELDAV